MDFFFTFIIYSYGGYYDFSLIDMYGRSAPFEFGLINAKELLKLDSNIFKKLVLNHIYGQNVESYNNFYIVFQLLQLFV